MFNNLYFNPKIFISFMHILLMITITLITIYSLNENIIFIALVIMMLIKISFYINNRCIVTYLEDGEKYASAPQLFGYTISKKELGERSFEEIIINTGLIIF